MPHGDGQQAEEGEKIDRKKELRDCRCKWDRENRTLIRCPIHQVRDTTPKRPFYYVTTPEVILNAGLSIKDELARALYFFIYLTGARINEVVEFSPIRMEMFADRRVVRLKTEKKRSHDNMRKVPIPLGAAAKCHEDEMWKEVTDYIHKFQDTQQPFRKWKNMSEYLARHHKLQVECRIRLIDGSTEDRIIEKRLHPHYLRHCRATHLVDYYQFTDINLCNFFRWSKADMALHYTRSGDVWQAFIIAKGRPSS